MVAGFFTLLLVGTLAYVWSLFAPIAPRHILNLWTILMGAAIFVMMAVPLIVIVRNPSDDEVVRVWAPVGKAVAVQYDITVALSIWMLLPYANEDLRLLMVIFFISAICGQVISTAEALANNAFGIGTILGSIVIFYLMTPGPYSVGIAIFCATFGLLLFAVAVTLRQAIRSSLVARQTAEATALQLKEALQEAEDERDGKARFIASASHDLRQPLHAASLFFEQSQRTTSEPVRQKAVEGVRSAFQSTGKLLDAILDHLKLESGTTELSLRPVCVDELFCKISSLHAPLARAAGMQIRVRPTQHWMMADPALIERVIGNLVVNGIKHSRGETVLLSSRRRGDRIEFLVVDDGVGIDPANRQRIFDEYAQGDGVKLDPRGGLGLGLASARRIMELHGARLSLNGVWKAGAAFTGDLPAAVPDMLQQTTDGAFSSESGSVPAGDTTESLEGIRILVVEDIEEAGLALVSLLNSFGAIADWVGSVHTARQYVEQNRVDIMITDWRLSLNETGADAIRDVRERLPDLPVLVLTGDGAPDALADISATGARLMHKPASPDRLYALLLDMLPPSGP